MLLRPYQQNDEASVRTLFYETIHTINAADYSPAQLDAWTDTIATWPTRLLKDYALVAEINGVIVGFGTMTATGELDLLYVHKDHQHQGIATQLVFALEAYASSLPVNAIQVFASITARSFFQKLGYVVVRENSVSRADQVLNNFLMTKRILPAVD